MCRHQREQLLGIPQTCYQCFYEIVDAEADRWMAKHLSAGYKTRDRATVRANIIRGLRIGTYQTSARVPLVHG